MRKQIQRQSPKNNGAQGRVNVMKKDVCVGVERILYFKRLKKHNNQMQFVHSDKILVGKKAVRDIFVKLGKFEYRLNFSLYLGIIIAFLRCNNGISVC